MFRKEKETEMGVEKTKNAVQIYNMNKLLDNMDDLPPVSSSDKLSKELT